MTGPFDGDIFDDAVFDTGSVTVTPSSGRKKPRRSPGAPITAASVTGTGGVQFGFSIHATGTVDDDDLALALL